MKKMAFTLTISLLLLAFGSQKARYFKLRDLDNKQVELKNLLAKGPVLLDFWATWCRPCVKAFPELDRLHKKYSRRGLTVLGINTDGPRNQEKVKPFVSSLKVSFPIVIDLHSEVMRLYRVQMLPTSVLIAPDGAIVFSGVGYSPKKIKELEAKIVALLEKASPHPPSK